MESHTTVIDSIIKDIKNGMLLRKPIVYLKTSNIEIVRRVLNSDQIVVRMGTGSVDEIVPFALNSNSALQGSILDSRVKNIKCYALSDLEETSLIYNEGTDVKYGIFTFLAKDNQAKDRDIKYLLPSMLVLSAYEPILQNANKNSEYFEKLFPFIDRYTQETDDSSAIRSSLVLLHGDDIKLPSWILPYCYIVEEPYPEREEIAEIIERKLDEFRLCRLEKKIIEEYATGFLGNTLLEVESIVEYLLNLPEDPITYSPKIENEAEVKKILAELKQQNVRRVGLLDLMKIDDKEKLGGMGRFTNWLKENKESIIQAGRIYRQTGSERQKGILMCGVPGCGKSAAVNILAKELKLPILKMDIGKLMGGYVGDSEHNMHKALRLAEAMSPCILYIDEIEKGFSGSDGRDDSGVTKRMFGILLTWMQECKKPVYIFATANSLKGLPKEFFRSGRFDSLFSLYMPTYNECIDIFKKRMEKAEEIVKEQNGERATMFLSECYSEENLGTVMNHLVSQKDSVPQHRFVSGADITKLVNMALRKFSNREGPIPHTEWIPALKNAANETIVYGDGEENLVSIAACYVQMMRLGFVPTCGKDDTLFEPDDYSVEYTEKEIKPNLKKKENIESEYDKALYNVIREKIIFVSKRLEESTLSKLID